MDNPTFVRMASICTDVDSFSSLTVLIYQARQCLETGAQYNFSGQLNLIGFKHLEQAVSMLKQNLLFFLALEKAKIN